MSRDHVVKIAAQRGPFLPDRAEASGRAEPFYHIIQFGCVL
jgi:hypothetical protein